MPAPAKSTQQPQPAQPMTATPTTGGLQVQQPPLDKLSGQYDQLAEVEISMIHEGKASGRTLEDRVHTLLLQESFDSDEHALDTN
ncbi:hypothetical protein MMC13_006906 [Lambiella insularis]|nr:hypothetical protein [Lambiella insularis]